VVDALYCLFWTTTLDTVLLVIAHMNHHCVIAVLVLIHTSIR
jgi:hypothetical protein